MADRSEGYLGGGCCHMRILIIPGVYHDWCTTGSKGADLLHAGDA